MTSPLTTPAASVPEHRWSPRLWGTLLVLCAAMFLDALDVPMVGVALPSIGSALHLSTSTLQWIVSGCILGHGGLLLPVGRTADLLGRRQVFLAALGVFAPRLAAGRPRPGIRTAGSVGRISRGSGVQPSQPGRTRPDS
ncbi:hypothetical protein GCM10020256_69170 [Streptomyces thermocoprophilus]